MSKRELKSKKVSGRLKHFMIAVGILSILISGVTWYLDLAGLVDQCIYCRTERTIIGILGLLMMIPVIPFVTRILTYALGFFGANVASQQVFMVVKKYTINYFLILAICALIFIMFQVFVLHYYCAKSKVKLFKDLPPG